ncbi:MAG: terminase large subunit domain-containing protein [Planctomycetota bacterium]
MLADARISKSALFQRIGYAPHPGQVLVHRSKARFRAIAAGTRWGKSRCAAGEAVAALLEPREQMLAWLVAPTYDVCNRIYARITGAVTTHFANRVIEADAREKKILVTNLGGGVSELRCKSSDHPASLLGEGLDVLIVDEAVQISQPVWEEHLAPRLIDREGWALLISTPQGPGWFFDLFRRGQKNRDPECESWSFPSSDNPHLNAAVIEAERQRLAKDVFAQQYLGEFLGVPLDPCGECGGPQNDVPGKIEAPEGNYQNDFLRGCPSCGMFVDEDGRCIVKLHNKGYASFWVSRHWTERGSVQMYGWYSRNGDGRWK